MSAENDNFTRLQTPGGGQVAARLFEPDRAPSMQVAIGAAMGVPQRRYAAFAGWLAGQGVLSFSSMRSAGSAHAATGGFSRLFRGR